MSEANAPKPKSPELAALEVMAQRLADLVILNIQASNRAIHPSEKVRLLDAAKSGMATLSDRIASLPGAKCEGLDQVLAAIAELDGKYRRAGYYGAAMWPQP
ncbi:MAG TPA: hypothetical protein VFE10_15920 [Phenylobacterium sp.]|jgi:hypothetical protein|nr:hypothetical protein [Phenylobacterium sp.]